LHINSCVSSLFSTGSDADEWVEWFHATRLLIRRTLRRKRGHNERTPRISSIWRAFYHPRAGGRHQNAQGHQDVVSQHRAWRHPLLYQVVALLWSWWCLSGMDVGGLYSVVPLVFTENRTTNPIQHSTPLHHHAPIHRIGRVGHLVMGPPVNYTSWYCTKPVMNSTPSVEWGLVWASRMMRLSHRAYHNDNEGSIARSILVLYSQDAVTSMTAVPPLLTTPRCPWSMRGRTLVRTPHFQIRHFLLSSSPPPASHEDCLPLPHHAHGTRVICGHSRVVQGQHQ